MTVSDLKELKQRLATAKSEASRERGKLDQCLQTLENDFELSGLAEAEDSSAYRKSLSRKRKELDASVEEAKAALAKTWRIFSKRYPQYAKGLSLMSDSDDGGSEDEELEDE